MHAPFSVISISKTQLKNIYLNTLLIKYTDSQFGIQVLLRNSLPFSYRIFDRNLLTCVRNTVSEPHVTSLGDKFSTAIFYIIRKLLSSERLSVSLLFPSPPPGFNVFPGQFPYRSNYFYSTYLGNLANTTLSAYTLWNIAQILSSCKWYISRLIYQTFVDPLK